MPLNPIDYEKKIYERGLKFERPPITCDSTKWEELAKDRLSAESAGYVWGSAGTRETHDKNLSSFKKWSIVPNRLVKSPGLPDLTSEIFGEKLSFPLALAPVGVQTIFNPEGEVSTSSAADDVGVPYILSTASATSIEKVAHANGDGKRWYQLYWPSNDHNDITISILKRAKAAGYNTLVVTLDTYLLGWRPSDMDNGYNPFLRNDSIGVEVGFSDPVFQKYFKEKYDVQIFEDVQKAASEWAGIIFPGTSHSWEDLKFLQEHWHGPIVLKGIQSVADAQRCVDAKVQGIVVSNHGGRQQDGGVGSLTMLPKIYDAVKGQINIIFDSGIRSGSDIVKALALGADLVLIGRPYIYGLSLGGKEGVKHVLECLLGELELTLHLAGIPSISKDVLNQNILVYEG
jgi:isopentenyl diphosphate isomerase/L-lactate dehydrogenase-like FMN-dependent dehydrogenase